MLRMVREASPAHPQGAAYPQLRAVMEVARGEFATVGLSTETRGGTTLDATIDLLLRTDGGLARGQRVEAARRDARGVARWTFEPRASRPSSPTPTATAPPTSTAKATTSALRAITAAPSPYPAYGRATVLRRRGARDDRERSADLSARRPRRVGPRRAEPSS
ncbi:MAG: hypothetical protein U0325_27495 [Polyangiales bacterium]